MILTATAPVTYDITPFTVTVPASIELDEAFVHEASTAIAMFPTVVAEALDRLVCGREPSGAVLLRGLPIGELPPTPSSPDSVVRKDLTSEFVLMAIARRLGEPVGYAPEHGGRIVQNIVPVRSAAARQVSTSSGISLDFHTETAFHPHKPRYLLLLCLRGDPAATTTLCSVDDALALLDDETIADLFTPRFRTRPDASFLTGADAIGEFGPPRPILEMASVRGLAGVGGVAGVDGAGGVGGAGGVDGLAGVDGAGPGRTRLTFDADLMMGIDPVAEVALAALRKAVWLAHVGVILQAGDLLVIDNLAAVHGRSPFEARYDGTDRWLQRTFVVPELTSSAADRVGRVITTAFH